MAKTKASREIEIKLPVPDAHALLRQLQQLRAQQIIPRTFESNTLYDDKSRRLTRNGEIIRIRTEHLAPTANKSRPVLAGHAILTYKGRTELSVGSRTIPGQRNNRTRFKIMNEIEVTVDDAERMREILGALGFAPVFRYEKFRTTYVLPGVRGLKVEFDETPIGLFLELEGSATSIDRVARLLEYSRSDYVAKSYGALYFDDCRQTRRKPSDMLFPTKKMR